MFRSIESYAFGRCTNLSSITIPDSVASIEEQAFWYCPTLGSVHIGNGVTNIGPNAFAVCRGLTNVMFGNGIRSIGYQAFIESSVRSIVFPVTLEFLGDAAFNFCRELTNVVFSNSGVIISNNAFDRCTNLAHVDFGNSVVSIGQGAFHNTALRSIVLPDSLSWLDNYTFSACSNLTSISLGQGITNVSHAAFQNCVSVTNVTLGSSVNEISWLRNFPALVTLTVEPGNPHFTSVDNVLFDKGTNTILLCPPASAGSYTIPDSVTTVGGGAFTECSGLTSIAIPSSVIGIEETAFSGCTSLREIAVDASNPAYSSLDGVLFDATRAVLLAYPPGRQGHYAVPSSVRRIDEDAFVLCNDMRRVYFWGDSPKLPNPPYVSVFPGVTIYYLPGTLGWSTTYAGRSTAPWHLPNPVVLQRSPFFGVRTNAFGFRVSWATNSSVVLEANANLAGAAWTPLQTNSLAAGWSYFSDPEWTNHPTRVCRVRQQ